jgi:hypothetical protein
MAEHDRQGTGKHGHKDTEEPYPHHQAGSQQGGGQGGSHESRGQGGGGQGGQGGQSRQGGGGQGGQSGQGEQESLKEREYRDKEGNVHHHTRTYEEQHGKDQGGGKR